MKRFFKNVLKFILILFILFCVLVGIAVANAPKHETTKKHTETKQTETQTAQTSTPPQTQTNAPEYNAALDQSMKDYFNGAGAQTTTTTKTKKTKAKNTVPNTDTSTNAGEIENSVKEFGGGNSFIDSGNDTPSGKFMQVIGGENVDTKNAAPAK